MKAATKIKTELQNQIISSSHRRTDVNYQINSVPYGALPCLVNQRSTSPLPLMLLLIIVVCCP